MSDGLEVRQQIAEKLLGSIEWTNTKGECRCPGADLHTLPGETATIYLDGVPNVHCFHTSCKAKVDEFNSQLRSAIADTERASGNAQTTKGRPKEKANNIDLGKQRLLMLARSNLNRIIAENPISDSDEWIECSPIRLPHEVDNDWRLLLQCLPANERVWIGGKYDSGSAEQESHFQTVQAWLAYEKCPGPYICPANFKAGSFRRSNEQIIEKRFIIFESDTLSKPESSSVILWLSRYWHLFAIVDTGGKSLHAWFEKPQRMQPDSWSLDQIVLCGLGCDTKMFGLSQPCRLPGCFRQETEQWQRLLYLNNLKHAIPADLSLLP